MFFKERKSVRGRLCPLLAVAVMVSMCGLAGAGSLEEAGWRPIKPESVRDNPVIMFGEDWPVLAAGTQGDLNAMTIGWGGFGTLWGLENAALTVYVEPSRHTHQFMEKNEYFTVTVLPENLQDALVHLGTHSGRDGDKIADAGLSLVYTEEGNPVIAQGRLVFECRKIYAAPMVLEGMGEKGRSTYSKGMQPHTMYIGEVVNAWIRE